MGDNDPPDELLGDVHGNVGKARCTGKIAAGEPVQMCRPGIPFLVEQRGLCGDCLGRRSLRSAAALRSPRHRASVVGVELLHQCGQRPGNLDPERQLLKAQILRHRVLGVSTTRRNRARIPDHTHGLAGLVHERDSTPAGRARRLYAGLDDSPDGVNQDAALNGGSRQSRIRRQVGFAICFLKLQWRNEQSVGVPDGPEETTAAT